MADEKDIKPDDEQQPQESAQPEPEAEAEAAPEAGAPDPAEAEQPADAEAGAEPAEQPDTPQQSAAEAMAAEALRVAREAVSSLGDENADAPVEPGASDEAPAAEAPHQREEQADAKPVDLPDLMASQIADLSDQGEGIDLLSDVNLQVKIELGRTRMYVEDVLRLRDGAVVELDKLAGDPVDVYVNDRPVARGEVLILNDNFCVRINEILTSNSKEA